MVMDTVLGKIDWACHANDALATPFVAAEVLNILVGSFGVIAVAPVTLAVAGRLYRFSCHTGKFPRQYPRG